MKYSLRSLMTFSIRDLFWFMAVVGLGLAWWIDRRGIQQDRDIWKYHVEGVKWLSKVGAKDIEVNGKEVTVKHRRSGTYSRTWPEESFWYDDPAEGPNRPKKPKW